MPDGKLPAATSAPPAAADAAGLHRLPKSRWFWLVLLLWLQCLLALPWLNEPFGDGRWHHHFDNAKFLRHALHSNYAPAGRFDARLLAGTAIWEFAADGSVTGPKFYARHPLLLPALFRGYVRLCGRGWWVPRSFMLLHLLLTLAFLFLLLDDSLRRPWLAALLTAWYALLPLNALLGIQWKYENGVVMWTLAAWWLAVQAGRGRGWRRALYVAVAALLQTDWYAYALAPFLLIYLARRRHEPGWRGVWWRATLAAMAGAALNALILAALMPDHDGSSRALVTDGGLLTGTWIIPWLQQQWGYLAYNFTAASRLLLPAGAGLALLAAWRLPAARQSALLWLAAGALAASLLWQLTLTEAAQWHHYYQWLFGLTLVLTWGWLLGYGLDRWRNRSGPASAFIVLAIVALAWLALAGTQQTRLSMGARQFGKADDYAAVAELPGRLLIFTDGRSGPPDWWRGPVISLLQDPLWRDNGTRGSVALLDSVDAPDRAHDLLGLINDADAQREGISEMRRRFGPATFKRSAATASFVFYAMKPEPPAI